MSSSTRKHSSNSRRAFNEGVHEMGAAMKDLASEGVGALRDRADEYMEHGRERAQEFRDSVQSRIQEQPTKSLLIAAGVGFLIGLLFRSRR